MSCDSLEHNHSSLSLPGILVQLPNIVLYYILFWVFKKMTLSTRAFLADGIRKYPCLFSASSAASLRECGALSATLWLLAKRSQAVAFPFFPGESRLFSLDLGLCILGEETQIKELKSLNEKDGWLSLGFSWIPCTLLKCCDKLGPPVAYTCDVWRCLGVRVKCWDSGSVEEGWVVT